jgi:hypothetical protein
MTEDVQTKDLLRHLEKHLEQENPVLQEVVGSFRQLDQISRGLGFFNTNESYAIRTPWWPLISILGTYSSGKSTFINSYLDYKLQATGNQAVDDKFTVMSYTADQGVHVLPGVALDSDPRFPLYGIGQAIEAVAPGEGKHVDSFLQLKTCPSEKLRGKILIDSPGFDADAQRTSTLRITDRIIDLSDLVLIFFDARHPEPGSMRDTLKHLVGATLKRRDRTKFLYILNQIDVTAQEDNPEQVFAAWQRALAEQGLTAGEYFCIYDDKVAVPIQDEELRARYQRKRDADLREINRRIEHVKVERAYRIVGTLEHTADRIQKEIVPRIKSFLDRWRRQVLLAEGVAAAVIVVLFLVICIRSDAWSVTGAIGSFFGSIGSSLTTQVGTAVVLLALGWGHFSLRGFLARRLISKQAREIKNRDQRENFVQAFARNTRWWRPLLKCNPSGWSKSTEKRLVRIVEDSNRYIQKLNDAFTDPSGDKWDDEGAGERSSIRDSFAPVDEGGREKT